MNKVLSVLSYLVVLVGVSSSSYAATYKEAKAMLVDKDGKQVGELLFQEVEKGKGVTVKGNLKQLAAGVHGFHIHETGLCEPKDGFKSANSHFNPENKPHGMHAGDLPNVTVDKNGMVTIDAVATKVTLGEGAGSLFDMDGSSIMVHMHADDYKDIASAGARVACGVIELKK